MEFRKLISFGRSSYVVSLPKSWLKKNNVQKGDLISLEESGPSIILNKKDFSYNQGQKTATINIDGKNFRRVQREILSAYFKNHKIITVVGKEVEEKSEKIRKFTNNLIALEVLEENSGKLVIKDFLNLEDISTDSLVRKIDMIIRSMLSECKEMFEKDNSEKVIEMDKDVNRLTFLLFRLVRFGYSDSTFVYKQQNLTNFDLQILWWFCYNLESIADEVKRIARQMRNLKLDSEGKEELLELLDQLKKNYLNTILAYNKKDVESAYQVLEQKEGFISKCEVFAKKNGNLVGVNDLVWRFKSISDMLHNMGRIVYQENWGF